MNQMASTLPAASSIRTIGSDFAYSQDDGGSLTYTLPADGDAGAATTTTVRIRAEEIVLVLEVAEASTGGRTAYRVFSLAEVSDEAAAAAAAPVDSPFRLSSVIVPALPSELVTHHLVAKKQLPPHLTCHAHHHLHVVVSTGSGTGTALAFYNAVLQPLLTALGLHPGGDGNAAISDLLDAEAGARASENEAESRPVSDGYSVLITRDAQSVRSFARRLARDPYTRVTSEDGQPGGGGGGAETRHTVILLSGDGGVVDMLNGMLDEGVDPNVARNCTVALLPLGTGNALFHSLHRPLYGASANSASPHPSPYVLGLRTLFRGSQAPLSSFQASFSPGSRLVSPSQQPLVDRLAGAIVASYGFHASLVWESDTPAYRVHGAARFAMAAQELLKTNHAYKAEVEVVRHGHHSPHEEVPGAGRGDGAKAETETEKLPGQEFGYVLLTMVSSLERTFTISPASKPLDGQLRLVHFGPLGAERTMEIMKKAYDNGSHIGMSWTDEDGRSGAVGYEEIDRAKVVIHEADPRWRKACIDGTIVEVPQDGWMAVQRMPYPLLDVVVARSVLPS